MSFNHEDTLQHKIDSLPIFIQTDKAMYKPSDTGKYLKQSHVQTLDTGEYLRQSHVQTLDTGEFKYINYPGLMLRTVRGLEE